MVMPRGTNGNRFNPDSFARALAPYFHELRDEMRKGFANVGTRIDDLGLRIDHLTARVDHGFANQGDHYRSLEARIVRIEKKVFPGGEDS